MGIIEITSQQQLDELPLDYNGRICIKFGTPDDHAIIRHRYKYPVEAYDNSRVTAWENSRVTARENSIVTARGNAQVVAASNTAVMRTSGNARIVHMPRTIAEYLEFYEIENDGETAKLYKAVHKIDGIYRSDYTSGCTYAPGETTEADALDKDPDETCGHGIHMAHLDWCLDYGRNWSDLAIIEVETEIDGIIVPRSGNGKVRAARCKMIREVPLEECGVYGKILAKRRSNA